MFNKIKGAFINAVNNLDGQLDPIAMSSDPYVGSSRSGESAALGKPMFALPSNLKRISKGPVLKYRYTRPHFLQLNSDDEIQVSADQIIRPIIVPRDIAKLSWNSGYAEAVNAGKSQRNEDQAAIHKGLLRAVISKEVIQNKIADMISIRKISVRPAYKMAPKPVSAPVSQNISKTSDAATKKIGNIKEENLPTIDNSQSDEVKPSIVKVEPGIEEVTSTDSNVSEGSLLNGTPDDLLSPSTPLPFSSILPAESEPIPTLVVSSIAPSVDKDNLSQVEDSLPYVYFGLFDGHAGSDVAVAAAYRLHKIVHDKLSSIADLLITFGIEENAFQGDADLKFATENTKGVIYQPSFPPDTYFSVHDPVKDKTVSVDNLISGALEKAFWDMDQEIERDKINYYMRGGCTALVSLFILGKLYVANAGDSRAIVHKNGEVIPMSFDFTPASERTRVKYLGLLRPDFLGNDFTHLEFIRRPLRKDLGKELLYRDAYMSGWAYKTVKPEDLKIPLIHGEGKRSRVAATIGVTRGFGDHELKAAHGDIYIKPFLTCQPEVKILDLETENLTDADVLIMGTDGLWDVTSNHKAAEIVQKALDHFPANDVQRFKYRYISAAQDLVMHSRGKSKDNGSWRTQNEEPATIDDISTFVIPLKPYQQEYVKWKEARRLVRSQNGNPSTSKPDSLGEQLESTKLNPK
ncbi:protein phosphatase 1H [Tetranychus urticae]|uniref:PPM-type phosphatase domain-containing protein n=2 Tax=Tetranychus urticae TaxID=32264 RepID=T1K989_TETUR|nr:protein phosphatase 1H [Tetranychus urticae]XP_015784556.1 protein phosphatase 1H [Tetranychus urticae]XP_015784557.1 protein phosphatase 1H [Tetranychus urticae]